MKRFLLIITVLLSSYVSRGQEQPKDTQSDIHRFSVSALAGLPRLAGVQAEYIIKPLNNHLGLNLSLSRLPNIFPYSKTNTNYFGLGGNWFFKPQGTGLYGGFEYGRLTINASEIDNRDVDLSAQFNWLCPKLGIKAGNRAFFRFELGYSLIFFNIDDTNTFLRETYGVEVRPSLNYLHFPNGSIGLGIAF